MKIFKRLIEQINNFLGKWTLVQKIIIFGIITLAVIGYVSFIFVSASLEKIHDNPKIITHLFPEPIKDEMVMDRIVIRIHQEGYLCSISADGIIMVENEEIARRMRAIMIREDLVPTTQQPWEIYDTENKTITDFERNEKLYLSLINAIVDNIKAIDDIDDVKIIIAWPEKKLFTSRQNSISASLTIIPKHGSDITNNRKKIEGIQKILKFAIEGLKDENIVITDQTGIIINYFEDLKEID